MWHSKQINNPKIAEMLSLIIDDSDEIGQIFTSQGTNVFTTGKH